MLILLYFISLTVQRHLFYYFDVHRKVNENNQSDYFSDCKTLLIHF